MIPILLWNLVFAGSLPESFTDDNLSPQWLTWLEHALRIPVFLMPIVWPLRLKSKQQARGFGLYCIGCLVYFASWLPLLVSPESAWSTSTAGLLAPAYTPIVFLLGIAQMASSRGYAALSLMFLALHNVSIYLRLHP